MLVRTTMYSASVTVLFCLHMRYTMESISLNKEPRQDVFLASSVQEGL